MMMRQSTYASLLSVVALLWPVGLVMAQLDAGGSRRLAVSWDDPVTGEGVAQAMEMRSPWNFVTPAVHIGAQSGIRSADGKVFAVSQADDVITVIDASSWAITDTFAVATGSALQDIAVVASDTAYVTRQSATHLLKLDPTTGLMSDLVDLSIFADSDGIPEMGTMAVQGGNLFIQIRRLDANNNAQPPAMLAVLDLATEQLVDVDPQVPGIQAIELQGTAPKLKMQTAKRQNRLYVSATGQFFDAGGIEEINTVQLQSEGLVIAERAGETGADLSTFVFTKPNGGFLVFTTDLAISSHFHAFTLSGGVDLNAPITARVGYTATALVFDRPNGTVFYPDGPAPNAGVLVLDAATGLPLFEPAVTTGNTPNDFAVILAPGAFE